jgi:Tfp pilus assembly PilM family ATPase
VTSLAEISQRFRALRQTHRTGPIGLHFADEQLHAVQLSGSPGGTFSLRSWASMSFPEPRAELLEQPDRVQLVVRQALKKGRFRGRHVVTAMPPEKLKTSSLTFTADPKVPDGEKILRLMSDRLDGDVADYVLDYLPIRAQSSDTERVVMVARCKRADVLYYLDCLSGAGVEVDAVEIGPTAIKRLVTCLPGEHDQENVLVVNFGWEKTYLTVMSGRRLLLDQEVDFGERIVIEQIAKSLDVTEMMAREIIIREGLDSQKPPDTEIEDFAATVQLSAVLDIVKPLFGRLAQEVKRACMYAAAQSQGANVERVYTLGSVARWPGADRLLSRMANIPMADLLLMSDVLEPGKGAPQAVTIGPDLAVATGLALRGLKEDA